MYKKILLTLTALLVLVSNLFAAEMENFLIPFSTYNDKWDHRWFTLLPESEQYESIEILSFDNKSFPNSLFVMVKLNWKYEYKQTLYFNNVHKAKSWYSDAKFADMVYSKKGEDGNPMSLLLTFTDEFDNDIEVNFSCDESDIMGSGYTDATKKFKQEVFSFIAYEKHCIPDFVSIQIGETKIAYDNLKDSSKYWKYKPLYSYNNFHFTIRGVERNLTCREDIISEVFADDLFVTNDSNEYILKTKNIGFRKYIEIKADTLKQIKEYTYYNNDEYIKISFNPPLHSTVTPEENEPDEVKKNKFTISASNVKETIEGASLSVLKYGYIHTEWVLLKPDWTSLHSFASDLVMLDKYSYKIILLPLSSEE